MVAMVGSTTRAVTLDERIDRMHARDRIGLIAFVVALWVAILFVFSQIWFYISTPEIRIILPVAAGLVLTLNTAAIIAMLRHYAHDKHFIYGLDLKHLDEMRSRRR